MSKEKFRGIFSPIVTPFTSDGEVNVEVLKSLVEAQLETGLNGFYPCGSTGEGLLMKIEERKTVADTVVRTVAGRGTVIVHVGSTSSLISAELAAHAEEIGADAVACTPPIFFPVTKATMMRHYGEISKATSLPFFIYSVPGFAGGSIDVEIVKEFLRFDNFAGLKFSDSRLYLVDRIKKLAPDRLIVFNGMDENFLPALTGGVVGSIGSTVNILPRTYLELYEAFGKGEMARAQECQHRINEAIELLLKYSLSFLKAVLAEYGFDCGEVRPPLPVLSGEERVSALNKFGLKTFG